MGDENSLQGRTQAHKHESASSTGGFLSTGLTGMSNLSNGSMVYGDASEIVTELNAGNLNDVLTMGASTPAWVASASGAAYEFLGSDSGTGVTSLSLNFTAVTPPSYVIAVYTGGCQAGQGVDWRINTISTGSSYQMIGSYLSGNPAVQGLQNNPDDKIYGALSGVVAGSPAGVIVELKVYINPIADANGSGAGNIFYENNMVCDGAGVRADYSKYSAAGSNTTPSQTGITDIEILGASFTGSLDVWKVTT